jgi:hypothetical protein
MGEKATGPFEPSPLPIGPWEGPIVGGGRRPQEGQASAPDLRDCPGRGNAERQARFRAMQTDHLRSAIANPQTGAGGRRAGGRPLKSSSTLQAEYQA